METQRSLEGFIHSYSGGRNETFLYGTYKDWDVHDYDIKAAYPSIISLVPTWDFNKFESFNEPKLLYDFLRLKPLSVGYVEIQFKFKDYVKYPSLPVKFDNGLYFVNEGTTICSLQEFQISYPHLETCEIIARVHEQIDERSVVSDFTRRLKNARDSAILRKDNLVSMLLKFILNSGYGKFLQGLSPKRGISLEFSTIDNLVSMPLPPSRIASPVIGTFIIGFVRAIVGEFLHYFSREDTLIGNVTTDGFSLLRES